MPGDRYVSLFSGLTGTAVMILKVERSKHRVNGEKYMIKIYRLIASFELFVSMMGVDFFGNL